MKLKKLLLALLALSLLSTTFLSPTFASARSLDSATILNELGLFKGVGTLENGEIDFDLNRAPTRQEAITMLVRLIGKEANALNSSQSIPFNDVDNWAIPYVSYAYANGLTNGISDTEFGGNHLVTPAQYLTFILRALGYESGEDFIWNKAWELSDTLGITYEEYNASTTDFLRADLANISANSLTATLKNSSVTLLEYLNQEGALADTDLVLMDMMSISCNKDTMSFAFFPVTGSENSYKTFTVLNATVNGIPCSIQQNQTAKDVKDQIPSIHSIVPNCFASCTLTYDEAAVLKAATETKEFSGTDYPVLAFTLTCEGTLSDGTKFTETFYEPLIIYGYGSLY